MLFNSYVFIFAFLPIVFSGFFFLARVDHKIAAAWLTLSSLFFYGWWNPKFVTLLLASAAFNYVIGYLIAQNFGMSRGKRLLILSITVNLFVLGIFKYANFFLASVDSIAGSQHAMTNIVLPLGISFFTFTQIAFLVDVHRGFAKDYNFIHYLLFVTYFPHLIAGPILHHKQMMPQFDAPETYRVDLDNISTGLTIFVIGLAKKVLLADYLSDFVGPVFDAARDGSHLHFMEAWSGALAYTLQLYFDFSGYSDMAIGLSWLFGIQIPINFNSPYKSSSIIDFWRRWHMTLSQFLRDYLYFGLGGNRKGKIRRYINLILTMLLGGLWHGANWTFVVWGGLHGFYLVVNHLWRNLCKRFGYAAADHSPSRIWNYVTVGLTFTSVVIAWVVFRAANIKAAHAMLSAMAGMGGFEFPSSVNFPFFALASLGLLIVWVFPNSQTLVEKSSGRYFARSHKSTVLNAVWYGLLLSICLISMSKKSEFLYFQF